MKKENAYTQAYKYANKYNIEWKLEKCCDLERFHGETHSISISKKECIIW